MPLYALLSPYLTAIQYVYTFALFLIWPKQIWRSFFLLSSSVMTQKWNYVLLLLYDILFMI